MKKITSFEVNHNILKPGLYVSRVDLVHDLPVTTYDLRLIKPNKGQLSVQGVHTLEHLIATFVRNHQKYGKDVLYFGPMGCLTGLYLILQGDRTSKAILPFVLQAFEFVVGFEGSIPGVSAIECGNYLLHDLNEAKKIAGNYTMVLKNATVSELEYSS